MDVVLAQTFLAVVETGSFVEAAKRVNVTQSTVSMRIKGLEDQLGRTLFERSKAGATLTPAGDQFQKHALAMVRVWEHARLEVALPSGYEGALVIGGQYSLWDGFLLDWISELRVKMPGVAIRTLLGFSSVLMQRLIDGTLDIGVMYTPQSRPGLEVELLFEEELVLVSSETKPSKKPGKKYIYVDWGPEFRADHSLNFPELSTQGLFMELGSLSLQYLLANQASGYFPRRVVQPYLESGELKFITTAPTFSYPAYVVFSAEADPKIMKRVLRILKQIAKKQPAY